LETNDLHRIGCPQLAKQILLIAGQSAAVVELENTTSDLKTPRLEDIQTCALCFNKFVAEGSEDYASICPACIYLSGLAVADTSVIRASKAMVHALRVPFQSTLPLVKCSDGTVRAAIDVLKLDANSQVGKHIVGSTNLVASLLHIISGRAFQAKSECHKCGDSFCSVELSWQAEDKTEDENTVAFPFNLDGMNVMPIYSVAQNDFFCAFCGGTPLSITEKTNTAALISVQSKMSLSLLPAMRTVMLSMELPVLLKGSNPPITWSSGKCKACGHTVVACDGAPSERKKLQACPLHADSELRQHPVIISSSVMSKGEIQEAFRYIPIGSFTTSVHQNAQIIIAHDDNVVLKGGTRQ
jgi:hypothetical protein